MTNYHAMRTEKITINVKIVSMGLLVRLTLPGYNKLSRSLSEATAARLPTRGDDEAKEAFIMRGGASGELATSSAEVDG
jgi:hypothetical protein